MTTPEQQLPVFYINLASRPDRRSFMEEQFARLGIKAERFDAVTIDQVPDHVVRDRPDASRLRAMTTGDLACGLSHQAVWRIIIERGLAAALVLEDDAVISPSLNDFLVPDILKRYGCDLLKLETRRTAVLLGSPSGNVGSATLHELQSSHLGSAAYVISYETAKRALESPAVNDDCVDHFLFGRRGPHLLCSKILQAAPSPVVPLDYLRLDPGKTSLSALAQGDLFAARSRRLRRRGLRTWYGLTRLNIDYVARLLRLLSRDRQALSRQRQPVPFAGDANNAAPAHTL